MYERGFAKPISDSEVLLLITKAAEAGNPEAQYRLGERFENGNGVPQDFRKAFEW